MRKTLLVAGAALLVIAVALSFFRLDDGDDGRDAGAAPFACGAPSGPPVDGGHRVRGLVISNKRYPGQGPEYVYRIIEIEVTGVVAGTGRIGEAPIVGYPQRLFDLDESLADAAPGDCVEGEGNVHMFACGPGCDAGGFVLDEASVVHRFDATAEPFVCGRVLPDASPVRFALYGVVQDIDRHAWRDGKDRVVVVVEPRKFRVVTPHPSWTPTPSDAIEVITTRAEASDVSEGDCVFVRGDFRGFACGLSCDAVGFLAVEVSVVR